MRNFLANLVMNLVSKPGRRLIRIGIFIAIAWILFANSSMSAGSTVFNLIILYPIYKLLLK